MSKRVRQYTPEEALALTLREATPNWYGSRPLIVGADLEEEIYPQPLDPSVTSGIWVFVFSAGTGNELTEVREVLSKWLLRYRSLGIQFVFSFHGEYEFFREHRAIENWLNLLHFDIPSFSDLDGTLAKAFGVKEGPGVALLHEGNLVLSEGGSEWMKSFENRLQEILRLDSAGLPFWPVLLPNEKRGKTIARWPLHAGASVFQDQRVELIGRWEFDTDRIKTSDSKAEIIFTAPASSVWIVGRSLSDSGEPTRIYFDFEGAPFSEANAGEDFSIDGDGRSSLLLSLPRSYSALRKLPENRRKIKFRFPFAKINSVSFYGLEFDDRSI